MTKKTVIAFFLILTVVSSFCACGEWSRFRTSDQKYLKQFEKKGLYVQIHYDSILNKKLRHIHSQPFDSLLPTIYFVHGAPGSSDNFTKYLTDSLLNKKANLISVDRLGYGFSEFGKAYTDITQQAHHLLPLLERYSSKIQPGLLVGWSYGGPIVAKMALDLPDHVLGVVLLAPALNPDAERYFKIGRLAEYKLTRPIVPKALVVAQSEKREHSQSLQNLSHQWKNLQPPILMVHGSRDKIVPYLENIRFAKKYFPQKMLRIIPIHEKGHVFPISRADQVITLITNHLDSLMNPLIK
jgi:pimeloyl-ACP methyl ester carboxylesterase